VVTATTIDWGAARTTSGVEERTAEADTRRTRMNLPARLSIRYVVIEKRLNAE
jgi:hypothetical protein